MALTHELNAVWEAPGGRRTNTHINFGATFPGVVMDQFRLRSGWPGVVAVWVVEREGCEQRVIARWPEERA